MKLPTINPKPLLKKIPGAVSGYVLEHQGTVLTGGTIVCNAAGIAVTYKNSPEIHRIISETRALLRQEDLTEEDQKRIQKYALIELSKLVAPIIIFFAGSTVCAIVNQKKNEAKIATLTAALTMAQNTISEYDLFKEEVRKDVGEEKYREIQQEVATKTVERQIQGSVFTPKPGEKAVWFPYIGKFISTTEPKIDAVMSNVNGVLRRNGIAGESYGNRTFKGNEIILLSDICRDLGMEPNDIPLFADEFGYIGGEDEIRYYVGSTNMYGEAYLCLLLDTKPSELH